MNSKLIDWLIFIILSIIWGSSFVLMKEGLLNLTAYQVASLRIISSGLVLLPVAYKSYKQIPRNKILYTFLSGTLGSLLPAYLFCIAEERIDSALAGVLNSLTPIFVIIVGALFFQSKTSLNKVIGIIIALTGTILLFFSQPGFSTNSNAVDVLLIVLATIMYGININMVRRYLHDIPSIQIASLALFLNAIPALVVLYFTGYFNKDFLTHGVLVSTAYSFLLGICGTAIASVIFYMLIKRAGAVFSSMVTYAIPLVAIIWGVIYGEKIGWKQVASLVIILAGVWVANKKGKI
ncbi:MAG: DMT family transporter [Ferruginibacter sp.]|nr:DMT family transporter [Ferruginibacter sp.]